MSVLRAVSVFCLCVFSAACVRIPTIDVDVVDSSTIAIDSPNARMDALDGGPSIDTFVIADTVVDAAVDATDAPALDSRTCMGGQSLCGANCADLQTSSIHCGMCGNMCAAPLSCESGECRCPGATVACGASCVDTTSDANHCGRCGNACPAGVGCMGGVCRCPMNATICAGTCVDLQSNTMNCGMCGTLCPAGQICTAGACGCAAPTSVCGAACVNLQTSNNNCGACGNRCAAGTSCTAGACVCPGMGATYCPGTMSCSVLANDPMNCGACGTVCPASQSCVSGSCQCPGANPTLCGAACVNTVSSNANCGACNNACPAAQTCMNSLCACPAAIPSLCGAACVNRQTDRNNCGACGTVCRMDQSCVAGTCLCPVGQTNCAGACVSTITSNAHCGACNNACNAMQTCVNSVCTCAAGLNFCAPNCVNFTNDRANCGACGTACSATQTCSASMCRCPAGTSACGAPGVCFDVLADPDRCGSCANVCPVRANATRTCTNGGCGFQCDAGFGDCDGDPNNGCEVNLSTSNLNCGSCGAQCASGMCVAGGCQDWARRFGGLQQDQGLSVAEDGDHNVYVVMALTTPFNVGAGAVNVSGLAGVLASFTQTGVPRWSRVFDTAGADEVSSIAVTGSGANVRVVIGGNVSDRVDAGGGLLGVAGAGGFIAEYNGTGTHLWSTAMRSTGAAYPRTLGIAFGPNLEVYAVGSFATQVLIQGNTIAGNNTYQGFLLKLDPAGTFVNGRAFGVVGYTASANAVAVDPFGEVYVTGIAGSVVNFGGGPRGVALQTNDAFIAKYDAAGVHVWSEMYGSGNPTQEGHSIVVDPVSNHITIAGAYAGTPNFGGGALASPPSGLSTFIAKFNSVGAGGLPTHLQSIGYATISTISSLSSPSITLMADGRLYLFTNYSNPINFGGFVLPGGGANTLLARLDPNMLTAINVTTFPSTGSLYPNRVASCGASSLCVTGLFAPNITFNTTTLTAGGNYDVFLARITRI